MQQGEGAAAAPTGCYKCGRPGHWARDCTFSSASNLNPSSNLNPNPNSSSRHNISTSNSSKQSSPAKKVPRKRPKLTPDMLLSDDGLGYVLRHFPRAFKYHGHGHEVTDLGNLIGMYADWQSHLLPYYSFVQFIHKVENVGASRRVRRCIAELKDRVVRGGDPTKLHDRPVELVDPDKGPDQFGNEGMAVEEPVDVEDQPMDGHEDQHMAVEEPVDVEDQPMDGHDTEHTQEEMINEIYQNATDDSCRTQQPSADTPQVVAASTVDPVPATSVEPPNQMPVLPRKIQITGEQKARMEANRVKALERAKQARSSQAS